jgi:transposase
MRPGSGDDHRSQGACLVTWLDCLSEREIAETVGVDHSTISRWVLQKRNDPDLQQPPTSRQHDVGALCVVVPTPQSEVSNT